MESYSIIVKLPDRHSVLVNFSPVTLCFVGLVNHQDVVMDSQDVAMATQDVVTDTQVVATQGLMIGIPDVVVGIPVVVVDTQGTTVTDTKKIGD